MTKKTSETLRPLAHALRTGGYLENGLNFVFLAQRQSSATLCPSTGLLSRYLSLSTIIRKPYYLLYAIYAYYGNLSSSTAAQSSCYACSFAKALLKGLCDELFRETGIIRPEQPDVGDAKENLVRSRSKRYP